jgi:hypothetical protein
VRNAMTWLSGADEEVLAAFPGDRAKFTALGAVMTATAVLAAASMWFFMHMALRLNDVAAVPFALLWGAGIISIDRMLVVSMRGRKRGTVLLQATPRFLLALLLGFVISTPITLQIFSTEINNQIKVIQGDQATAFAAGVNNGVAQQAKQYQQSTTGSAEITSLKSALATAQSTLATDKQQQLRDEQRQAADYDAWHCELYGGPGCTQTQLGDGPAALQDYAKYLADTKAVSADTTAVQKDTSLAQSATTVLDTATAAASGKYKSLVTGAQSQGQAEITAYNSQNPQDTGFLIHLQALDQLTGDDTELSVARWALFALFAAFEILPVLTKTLQQLGPESAYDRGLDVADKKRLAAFEDALNKAHDQVVAHLAAAHLRVTQLAADGLRGSASSRRRHRRLLRSSRPSQPAPSPGGAPVVGKLLQRYRPSPQAGNSNGNGASSVGGQPAGSGS